MDLPNILNQKGPAAAAAAAELQQHLADQQQQQQQQQQVNGHAQHHHHQPRALSDAGSERGVSPHMSDPAQRFPPRGPAPFPQSLTLANAQARYPDQIQAVPQQFPLLSNPYPTPTASIDGGYSAAAPPHQPNGDYRGAPADPNGLSPDQAGGQSKAFACSNCGKGFARRSDLARHERIHTGIRPHVCDFPGCNKQFIQRSALTVHARVHTGEKPHMCEHCTKPFSDSSSLARHRRIHSGKRPYKCPYADCQKTFTRRTTLTRHKTHHSGTVEEAAAATAAALASRPAGAAGTARPRSDGTGGGMYSDTGSTPTTPSPSQRTMSMSPASDMPSMPLLGRHHSDLGFFGHGGAAGPIPHHLRTDFSSSHSPRSGSVSPSLSAYGGSLSHPTSAHPTSGGGHRPSLTSHPQMYNQPPAGHHHHHHPPPTLEPPAHHAAHEPRSATGSVSGGSPHLSSVGWQSPTAGSMGSPVPSAAGGPADYMYPEPAAFSMAQGHLYYPSSNMRRPTSTEPQDHYAADVKHQPRLVQGEVWSGQM